MELAIKYLKENPQSTIYEVATLFNVNISDLHKEWAKVRNELN